ncbi:MAG: NAD(P)H-hydrate dehydratase [Bacteroidales bacterium]|nr:NAD(P)H-hydrate dehydratase [Bacteroidales bacterium]
MKILTVDKIREADAYTIEHEPVSSIDLMERAARQLLKWITDRYSMSDPVIIFVGPGNNGGDGWALARLLCENYFRKISVYLLAISEKLSPDSMVNRERLAAYPEVQFREISSRNDFPGIGPGDVIIDALFGSGLSRPLSGLAAELVSYINGQEHKAVVSVDIPSGLSGDGASLQHEDVIIRADYTLSFQFPKLAFMVPENDAFVGEWHILPIALHPDFIARVESPYFYVQERLISGFIHPRKKFSHKGTYGHALLIAGSYGMMGAAVLAAGAAIRSGPGLLTTHVPRLGVAILQASVPESLITIDESDLIFTEHPDLSGYSAIGIGPGINQKSNTKQGLQFLLESVGVPLIIDADGLNLLAQLDNWQEKLPENCVLTPHPKEFERLFGRFPDSFTRLEAQRTFSQEHKAVVVLKGAHTCITTPEGRVWFNSTGNPGMAKGGSGDVLTGIILGLLAQGYPISEATITGVYIHGLAGDLAAESTGLTSLLPSDLIAHIGKAFCKFERR